MNDGVWTVFADGASRGNPGPASIGAAVYDPSGVEAHTVSRRLGRATNNEAEWQAAIAGVE
ncbi:MAG TPA: RNase H family protein, partial [Dehalococcoidia bacterium]|nr:RNase H family protein [Dehalococcoidia bacterium]